MIRVVPSHTRMLSHEARFLACAADRSRLVLASGDGRFAVADAALRIVHEGKLPVPAGALAIHPTADLLAIASRAEVVVASFSGTVAIRRRHRPWRDFEGGDVAFLRDGARLLAVCSSDDAATLMLLDTGSGSVIAERALDVPEPAGFHLIRHPAENRWALWAGAGQDGQWTYWIGLERDELLVEEVSALTGKEHGPVEFLRSSDEFVVAADGGLERRAVRDGRLLRRLDPPGEGFSVAETTCDLGSRRALVTDPESSRLFVVELDAMSLGDEVVIQGHEPRPLAELHPGATGEDRSLCTDLWYLRGLPRAAAVTVHGAANRPQTIALLEGPPLFAPAR